MKTLYKGPFIPIVSSLLKNDIYAICGWFTIKNFTINYLYEWDSNKNENKSSKILPIKITDYSKLDASFKISLDSISEDYGNMIEKLEYFPYEPVKDDIKFYHDLKNKNIC